jgi:hypothetical protein
MIWAFLIKAMVWHVAVIAHVMILGMCLIKTKLLIIAHDESAALAA